MSRSINYVKMYRYFWMIGAVMGTLLKGQMQAYPVFIFVALVVFINAQLRPTLFRHRLFLVSLFIEILLVVYLQSLAAGYVYLVLFSTLADVVLHLKEESYLLFVFMAAALVFMLYPLYPSEWFLIILLFFTAAFLLQLHLRQELNARTDTEALYDQEYALESTNPRLL